MPSGLSADDKARRVLQIFQSFGSRPGEALDAQSFVRVGTRRGWALDEIADGIEDGESRGWFERADNGWIRLTQTGFSETLGT
jgi:hypothetical protein